MLHFNGKRFAESDREAVESLFTPGGTVDGMAKRKARCIDLMELNGRHAATITRNGIVATATAQEDGRTWFSYGWPAIAGPELGLMATRDAIESIATRRAYVGGETVYWFK